MGTTASRFSSIWSKMLLSVAVFLLVYLFEKVTACPRRVKSASSRSIITRTTSTSTRYVTISLQGPSSSRSTYCPTSTYSTNVHVPTATPRNIIYVNDMWTVPPSPGNAGQRASLLPLIQNPSKVTHVILFSFSINKNGSVTFQNYPLGHPYTSWMFEEAKVLQKHGVKVLGSLGGAYVDVWTKLRRNFNGLYPLLLAAIKQYSLDGLDLDVEATASQAVILRLLYALYHDMGASFILTMAPVMYDMLEVRWAGTVLNYTALDQAAVAPDKANGKLVDWYNVQFYCCGSVDTPRLYKRIIGHGWQPERMVLGLPTYNFTGSGWKSLSVYQSYISLLKRLYPTFGGVFGWEFFDAGKNDAIVSVREERWKWLAAIGST